MRPLRALPLLLGLCLLSSGCYGYRLMRPEEIELPSYTPRPVAVPAACEGLIAQAVERGFTGMPESSAQMVLFCQQQMMLRAEEEEVAERRIEAHARAAEFALQAATVVLTATFAIVGWLLF